MVLGCQQLSAEAQFNQRDSFLNGTSCDSEEVAPVRFGETTASFGDVFGDVRADFEIAVISFVKSPTATGFVCSAALSDSSDFASGFGFGD